MRPEVAAEVREWLERAADDLREAEHDLTAAPLLARGAVFHSQQAAEKALKAFLSAHERLFPRTHDLDELGREVVALDSTEDETREALALAREVYSTILARLPEGVWP